MRVLMSLLEFQKLEVDRRQNKKKKSMLLNNCVDQSASLKGHTEKKIIVVTFCFQMREFWKKGGNGTESKKKDSIV
jgi:hypothetical protein